MQKVVLALLAGAAAFQAPAAAPATTARASASVDETRIGVQAPAGFWDPLGLSTTQPEGFERRRAVERKHGRIAMVAITGCVLHNADVEFPGYLSLSQQLKFSDIPNGGQGIFNIPAAGVAQILLFCGLVEMAWWPASKYDGDYNVGFFGEKLSPEKKTQKLNAEMANGRLAMLGIFGNMVAEAQTAQTLGEQMGAGNMSLFHVDPKTPPPPLFFVAAAVAAGPAPALAADLSGGDLILPVGGLTLLLTGVIAGIIGYTTIGDGPANPKNR